MTWEWQKLDPPYHTYSRLPNEDRTRSNTENFPSLPHGIEESTRSATSKFLVYPDRKSQESRPKRRCKTSNELRTLLKFHNHPKKMPGQIKRVKKRILHESTKFPKVRRKKNHATSFPESPTIFFRIVYLSTWTRWGEYKKLDLHISRIRWNRRSVLLAIWSI